MTSILLMSLALAAAAITLPVVVELALATLGRLLPKKPRSERRLPQPVDLAVVVPAHNEEDGIARTVESLLRSVAARPESSEAASFKSRSLESGSQGWQVPILVVAHNCSDQTARRAREAGAEVEILRDPEQAGKGFALRRGFEAALRKGARAVLVIDADSTVSLNLVAEVEKWLAEGAEALQCRYEFRGASDGQASLSALATTAFNFIRPAGRSRLGLSAGILGNGFALTKPVLLRTPYAAHSLVEDLEYHIELVLGGTRVEFLDEATVFSDLPAAGRAAEAQRSRWEGGRFQVAKKWLPKLAAETAHGHFRAIEPMIELGGLPLAYAATALGIAILLALAAAFSAGTAPGLLGLEIYIAAALGILAAHVVSAALADGHPARDLRLLLFAPAYVAWKLSLFPRLIRNARPGAAWVRTDRSPSRAGSMENPAEPMRTPPAANQSVAGLDPNSIGPAEPIESRG